MSEKTQKTCSDSSARRVVIIGAGWYGLAAAKTYLQINPSIDLTIIDSDSSVGGTWSASRVYPGLVADTPVGNFDYSDLPMENELGLKRWDDIPAVKVHEYLERYAEKFDLVKRLKLRTKVLKARRSKNGGWDLEVEFDSGSGEKVQETLSCDKLIVATGITSVPKMPELNVSNFEGRVLHSKDFGIHYEFITSNTVNRVTVVGGCKSAVDIAQQCALAGKEVDWLIREEGKGSGTLINIRAGGFHGVIISNARWYVKVCPSYLRTDGFLYKFLHSGKSKLGSGTLDFIFKQAAKGSIGDTYEKSEQGKLLAPTVPIFWDVQRISTMQSTKLMEMVDEGKLIHVHRASVISATGKTVNLSNNVSLPSDAIIFATGWEVSPSKIFEESLYPDLGLPVTLSKQHDDLKKHWDNLDTAADKRILSLFPFLANPPDPTPKPKNTPFRLYQYMVPPNLAACEDRSLIFLGNLRIIQVSAFAEISSLWGVAYLEDLLPEKTKEIMGDRLEMEKKISLMNAFMMRRYRSDAYTVPHVISETQHILDDLMMQLGLKRKRKRNRRLSIRGGLKEVFYPYTSADYRGIVEEFLKTLRGTEGKGM